MTEPHDRRLHAETLRRHLRYSRTKRFKRQVAIMVSSIVLGGLAAPSRPFRTSSPPAAVEGWTGVARRPCPAICACRANAHLVCPNQRRTRGC